MRTAVRKLKRDKAYPWAVVCSCRDEPINQFTNWHTAMDGALWHVFVHRVALRSG